MSQLQQVRIGTRASKLALIQDAYEARVENAKARALAYKALPPEALYMTAEQWDARVATHPNRWFTPF